MRVEFELCPAQCPQCGNELDVPAGCPEDVIEVTCRMCKRPSTFENALYRQWLDQGIKTLQVTARASRFAHRKTWAA